MSASDHVRRDRGLGELEPQLEQFTMDAGSAPQRVLFAHRRIRSRRSRSIRGRPARFRDFQRQELRNPARCHRKIVAGSSTRARLSRLGHNRVRHTSSARSLPRSGERSGRRLTAISS